MLVSFPPYKDSTCSVFPCIAAARGGVQVFSTFRPQMFPNLYSPASAAQHPQPCLLLLRRSNECRFPSHHTKTAHALYSPAYPRARGGVQVFSTFRPQMFQTLTPPRPRPSTPNPAYCFSEEATNVGFLPTIQRQHVLCIPLHCTGFQHFQAPNVPKPAHPRIRGPAPPTLLIAPPKK